MISLRKPYLRIEDLSWLPVPKAEKVTILKVLNRLVVKEIRFNHEIRLRLISKIFEIHKNKSFYKKKIEKLTELNLDYVFYAVRKEVWSEFGYLETEKQYEESDTGGCSITFLQNAGVGEFTALPKTVHIVEVKDTHNDDVASLGVDDSLIKAIARLSDEQQEIIRMYFYDGYQLEEIATKFCKSKRTILDKKAQALAKLKELLGEDE